MEKVEYPADKAYLGQEDHIWIDDGQTFSIMW
jgi:hypothetical protein